MDSPIRTRGAIGDTLLAVGFLSALFAFFVIPLLSTPYFPGYSPHPPTLEECVDAWSEDANAERRRNVARQGFRHAAVEGTQTQGVYGGCSVTVLEADGAWVTYGKLVYGTYPGASHEWGFQDRGDEWGVDDGRRGTGPAPNALIDEDGGLILAD